MVIRFRKVNQYLQKVRRDIIWDHSYDPLLFVVRAKMHGRREEIQTKARDERIGVLREFSATSETLRSLRYTGGESSFSSCKYKGRAFLDSKLLKRKGFESVCRRMPILSI